MLTKGMVQVIIDMQIREESLSEWNQVAKRGSL